MSYQKVEVHTVTVQVQKVCNSCGFEQERFMYSICPEEYLSEIQALHFCSSVCFKDFIEVSAKMFKDGAGARSIFPENL